MNLTLDGRPVIMYAAKAFSRGDFKVRALTNLVDDVKKDLGD